MEIAVIGGGHGCYAAAAHLTEVGHNVRHWRRDVGALTPSITLTDWQGTREVAIARPTENISEAMADAELVVIPLPATSHFDLSKKLASLWQEGQVAFLPPGTMGTYMFAKAARDAGNPARAAFAETGTLPYLARKQAANHVSISVYATRLPTGVFPAAETNHAIDVIGRVYPVESLTDALDGALMNAGPIIHPPLIVMNAGPLEHFDAWDIHNEGTQPSIRRTTDALDAERVQLREAFGYCAPHFPLSDHYDDARDEWMYGNASHERLTKSGDWREDIDLLTHRYMVEDTRLGLSLLSSLGELADIPLPLVNGFLAIGGAITGENFRVSGRGLQALGLGGHGRDELKTLLSDGFAR
ncbi:MAG: NAD/NADP octopine/nopaline dehydrogenase family protein [Pseudomonadota bacterium]|nr:NAD/NADP octopine/nopaline dehydrogenase family protein [Pseudomonadota bacterium]